MSDIILKHNIANDSYTDYIYRAYDIQNQEESVTVLQNNLKLDFEYNLGVIAGASGTGKTSLLKSFGELPEDSFDSSKALISNFSNLTPEEASFLLSSVGLSSVPSWLRPYNVLSTGEKYRASLAKELSLEKPLYIFDEFSSVLDRDVAKSLSNALSKYIRRSKKKVILATPHFDVLDWLSPDWVYSTETCQLERAGCLWRRPKVELEIFRCKYEAWDLFKSHHYLTDKLHKSSACFLITWENKIVGFIATLDFPGLNVKAKRVTRFVVLPDFQGLGIGKAVLDYMSGLYKSAGYVTYIRTVNPALGETLCKSLNWQTKKETNKRDRYNNDRYTGEKKFLQKYLINRPSYSCKYVGEGIYGDLNIVLKKNKELDYEQN